MSESYHKPHPNPGKPYLTQALVVVWYGEPDREHPEAPRKVSHYNLLIQQVIPDFEIFVYKGKEIPLPKCTTVISTKITKENAKKLIDLGIKPGAGAFSYRNPRSRKKKQKNLDKFEK